MKINGEARLETSNHGAEDMEASKGGNKRGHWYSVSAGVDIRLNATATSRRLASKAMAQAEGSRFHKKTRVKPGIKLR